jgi:hypothetical protein
MNTRITARNSLLILTAMVFLSGCASPVRPPAAPTGVAGLDAIIAAVLAGDTTAQKNLIGYTEAGCSSAEGLGGPPPCLPGEPEGTPVEVLPILGAEGGYIRKSDIGAWEGLRSADLYAAYEVSDAAYTEPNFPAGEYALVFGGTSGTGSDFTLQVRDGRIVRIDHYFGADPRISREDVVRYLVSPR